MRGWEVIIGCQSLTPIDGLQLFLLVDTEYVADIRGVDAEHTGCGVEVDSSSWGLRPTINRQTEYKWQSEANTDNDSQEIALVTEGH